MIPDLPRDTGRRRRDRERQIEEDGYSCHQFYLQGSRTAEHIQKVMACCNGPANYIPKCSDVRADGIGIPVEQPLFTWAGEQFAAGNALLFIGACGIAVRSIAPHVKDKLSDVPVLVADEAGQS